MSKLERLNDDALLLLIVADLCVTCKREVLAQRVALEAIVGHDTAQIGMADKEHTKHVVDLTLVPVGAHVQAGNAGNRSDLVGVGLDADARVVPHAQQVVDDLKAHLARGEVDSGDIADLGELGIGIVCGEGSATYYIPNSRPNDPPQDELTLEERENGDDASGADVDGKFVLPDGELLDVLGQAAHEPRAVLVQVVGLALVLIGRVDEGLLDLAHGLTGDGTRIWGILGEGHAEAGGGGERAHNGDIGDGLSASAAAGDRPQGRGQGPGLAELAGHGEWWEFGGRVLVEPIDRESAGSSSSG